MGRGSPRPEGTGNRSAPQDGAMRPVTPGASSLAEATPRGYAGDPIAAT